MSVEAARSRAVADDQAALTETDWVAITTGQYPVVDQIALPRLADIVSFIPRRIAAIPGVRDIRMDSVLEMITSFDGRE